MNQLTIIGNLTKDPELRTTPSGKTVCKFTVAVNDGFGENKKVTYFDVDAWGNYAEPCSKYLKKGSKIMAQGKASCKPYVKKDGSATGNVILSVSNIEFLFTKKDTAEAAEQAMNQPDMDLTGIDIPF